jgi:hypothetical protein
MLIMEGKKRLRGQRAGLTIGLSIATLSVDEFPMLTDNLEPLTNHARYSAAPSSRFTAEKYALGRVDGFDQDECAGECDERGEVSRGLLAA